jgi:hypothetical protein
MINNINKEIIINMAINSKKIHKVRTIKNNIIKTNSIILNFKGENKAIKIINKIKVGMDNQYKFHNNNVKIKTIKVKYSNNHSYPSNKKINFNK